MKKEDKITWSEFLGVDIGLTENNSLAKVNPELAKEWNYEKNGDLKPEDVTCGSGKKVWWICKNGHEWESIISNRKKGVGCPYCCGKKKETALSYDECKKIVQKLKIKVDKNIIAAWNIYKNSDSFSLLLPKDPYGYYKSRGEWVSWEDFFGLDNKFIDFEEARKFSRSLNLKSKRDWENYCKEYSIPENIPKVPRTVYKSEWIGWGDWTGSNNERINDYLTFNEARKIIISHKFKNIKDFKRNKKYFSNIPSNPNQTYKKDGWGGWGDFLGTGSIANFNKQFLTFNEAKRYVKKLKFKSSTDYVMWAKTDNRPYNIPSSPVRTYKDEWISWNDFLVKTK